MFSPHILVYLQLGLALFFTVAVAEPSKPPKNEAESDYETFQRLLQQADPPALHAALHGYSPKFKHGMFREDKSAVEFIHRDDASLATSIIKFAKRQENLNGTLTSATPPKEPSTTPAPIDRTSEGGASGSNTESSAAPNSATPVVSITLTSTEAPQATSSAPSVVSSTESPSRTPGSVYTYTDSSGVIIITTVDGEAKTIGTTTPPSSTVASNPDSTFSSEASITSKPASRSSLFVRTTTLPNGSKSTITHITVVPGDSDSPTPNGEAGAGSGTRTGTAAPGVQTGAAAGSGCLAKGMLFLMGGLVGGAMLI